MKILSAILLTSLSACAAPTVEFVNTARETHGAEGERASRFLLTHMPAPTPAHRLGMRLLNVKGERIAGEGSLVDENGQLVATFVSAGGRADMNHLPEIPVVPGRRYRLRIGDRQTGLFTAKEGVATLNAAPADFAPIPAALSREAAEKMIREETARLIQSTRAKRQTELDTRSITIGEHELRWEERVFGDAPQSGRSLWISLHGGGGTTKEINDQQWRNQVGLYQPAEGIYIAPRAPTDAWNMWHQDHIDPLLSRLIENHIALRGVDPAKIYLMGYSAGGDGVWQLAPRMPDRFAAAAMMVGHPNESSLPGLRNLPFALFMGGNDNAYNRAAIAREKKEELDQLREKDPGGYRHFVRIYEGLGHWMNGKDREALPWMAGFVRTPWPRKVVWLQDDVTHDRFYWLKLPKGTARPGQYIEAEVEGQTITLSGDVPDGIRVRLSDALLNLDQPIVIKIGDRPCFEGKAPRSAAAIRQTLAERLDRKAAATAEVVVYR